MSRSKLFVWALVVASLTFITGSAWAQDSSPCNAELREQMRVSAEAAGISINTDDIVASEGDGITLATATIAGYESVPPSALPEGVNAGFIYLDARDSYIPAGFYTLRASTQESIEKPGLFQGSVDLVSADGTIAATVPSSVDVFSPEVPNPLPFPRTIITQELERTGTGEADSSFSARRIGWTIRITIRCPNGGTIRITIRF